MWVLEINGIAAIGRQWNLELCSGGVRELCIFLCNDEASGKQPMKLLAEKCIKRLPYICGKNPPMGTDTILFNEESVKNVTLPLLVHLPKEIFELTHSRPTSSQKS